MKNVMFLMVRGLGDPMASPRRYRGTSRRHRGTSKALSRRLEAPPVDTAALPRRARGSKVPDELNRIRKRQRCLINFTEITSVKDAQVHCLTPIVIELSLAAGNFCGAVFFKG